MYISNSPRHNYGGFQIDPGKIKMHSVNERNIELPYTGDIPDDLKPTITAARIGVYVAVTRTPAAVLILTDRSGKDHRYTLDATSAELEEIMHRFFFNEKGGTRFDCGLTRYSVGFAQAHFIAWEALQHRPQDILKQMPQVEQRGA